MKWLLQEVVTEDLPRVKEIMNNCQNLKTKDRQKIEDIHGNPTELALLKYIAEEEQQLKPIAAQKSLQFQLQVYGNNA